MLKLSYYFDSERLVELGNVDPQNIMNILRSKYDEGFGRASWFADMVTMEKDGIEQVVNSRVEFKSFMKNETNENTNDAEAPSSSPNVKDQAPAGRRLPASACYHLLELWKNFRHDGIIWTIDDNGKTVLAEGASKEFYNQLLHRIENESYSPEDVQAIQNYCLGDFRYHCYSPNSNYQNCPEPNCPTEAGKLSSDNSKQVPLVFEGQSKNFGQGIVNGPNPQQWSNPSLPLYRPTQDYLEEILSRLESLSNRLNKYENEHSPHSMNTKTNQNDPSSKEGQIHQENSTIEIGDSRILQNLGNIGRESDNSFSCDNVKDQAPEGLPASACSGLVGFTEDIHGRYILGVPDNPTGIPCMSREHAEEILQRTLHHSKIRVSSKNDTMEFSRHPQGWNSETYRLEDWLDEQEENLGPAPELNPKLNLTPPIKSLDELN